MFGGPHMLGGPTSLPCLCTRGSAVPIAASSDRTVEKNVGEKIYRKKGNLRQRSGPWYNLQKSTTPHTSQSFQVLAGLKAGYHRDERGGNKYLTAMIRGMEY